MMKTYSELIKLETFEDRFDYLYIGDKVGRETFGNSRWLNQQFYTSHEWRRKRNEIIARDNGCDLGVEGCELCKKDIIVHHINPITEDDIINRRSCVFDNENLISTSRGTHTNIHYSGEVKQLLSFERSPNDTCPWKK